MDSPAGNHLLSTYSIHEHILEELEYLKVLANQVDIMIREAKASIEEERVRMEEFSRISKVKQINANIFIFPKRGIKKLKKKGHRIRCKKRQHFVFDVQKTQISDCNPYKKPEDSLWKIIKKLRKSKNCDLRNMASNRCFKKFKQIWVFPRRKLRKQGDTSRKCPIQQTIHIIRNIGKGQYQILKTTSADASHDYGRFPVVVKTVPQTKPKPTISDVTENMIEKLDPDKDVIGNWVTDSQNKSGNTRPVLRANNIMQNMNRHASPEGENSKFWERNYRAYMDYLLNTYIPRKTKDIGQTIKTQDQNDEIFLITGHGFLNTKLDRVNTTLKTHPVVHQTESKTNLETSEDATLKYVQHHMKTLEIRGNNIKGYKLRQMTSKNTNNLGSKSEEMYPQTQRTQQKYPTIKTKSNTGLLELPRLILPDNIRGVDKTRQVVNKRGAPRRFVRYMSPRPMFPTQNIKPQDIDNNLLLSELQCKGARIVARGSGIGQTKPREQEHCAKPPSTKRNQNRSGMPRGRRRLLLKKC